MFASGGKVGGAPPPVGGQASAGVDQNPGTIKTSDRPIFPGVPPAEAMLEIMASQNPEESVGGLLQQLAALTHRGAGSEEGPNIPETSPNADRHFMAAPEAFRVWIGTVDPAEVNELGDSLKQAADANPDQIDELWSIVEGLAQDQPDLLPPDLLLLVKEIGTVA